LWTKSGKKEGKRKDTPGWQKLPESYCPLAFKIVSDGTGDSHEAKGG